MIKVLQIISLLSIPILTLIPIPDNAFTICPFFLVTGFPCPSCGLGRSLIHIYHFDLLGAIFYNPFGYVVFVIQLNLILGLFFTSIIEFIVKQSRTLVAIEIIIFILFLTFGLFRILFILEGNMIFPKYFYNFS